MDVQDSRIDCTFELGGWTAHGLAHIIDIKYSDRIRFCNFVMQITTDQLDGAPNVDMMTPAGLTLEDGRKASVRLSHFQILDNYFELAGAGSFDS
jgi:hypothetical protein